MYDTNNIFNKIINKQLECDLIYEDEQVLAFHDKYPDAKVHILVIPKGEYISFVDFIEKNPPDKIAHFFKKVKDIAREAGLNSDGYRIASNHGKNANQAVPHFHFHILGGEKLVQRAGAEQN